MVVDWMRFVRSGSWSIVALLAAACSSGGGTGGGGNCSDLTGSGPFSGTCPASGTCNLVQNGCSASLTCGNSTVQGTVNGNTLSFEAAPGVSCTGDLADHTISGTCSNGCTFSATGFGTTSGGGGGSGFGGGGFGGGGFGGGGFGGGGSGGVPPSGGGFGGGGASGGGGFGGGGAPGGGGFGGGGASGGSGGVASDGGPVSSQCVSCGQSACPSEASACISDSVCQSCVLANSTAPQCATSSVVKALLACACASCPTECAAVCP